MFTRTMIITPHFDDETIGCGGLLSNIMNYGSPNSEVCIVVVATNDSVFNYNVNRIVSNEERKEESLRALECLGVPSSSLVQLSGFKDGNLDTTSMKNLVTQLDKVIREFRPTAVLFPYSSHHQDHQAVYRASVAALRPTVATNYIRLKAAYEYPYITASWNSSMNSNSRLYVPLTELDMENKKRALMEYKTQLVRDPRDILDVSSILNLARVRGTEIGHDYAEVFYPMSIIAEV